MKARLVLFCIWAISAGINANGPMPKPTENRVMGQSIASCPIHIDAKPTGCPTSKWDTHILSNRQRSFQLNQSPT